MGFSRAPMLQFSRHGYKQQHAISCLDPWHWLQRSKDKVRPDPKLHWCLGADFKHQGTALWKVPCPTQSLLKPLSLLKPFQRSCTSLGSCGFALEMRVFVCMWAHWISCSICLGCSRFPRRMNPKSQTTFPMHNPRILIYNNPVSGFMVKLTKRHL